MWIKQFCYVGNTAKQCRLRLFQDSDFARDLEDSKSTSGGTLCIFGSHTFVPKSWMCRTQTSVSHGSTESEIISLDAGLRLDGKPALDLWDLIIAVLHGNTYRSNQVRWDPCTNLVRAALHKLQMRKKSHGMIDDLDFVDFISSNVHSSRQEALLYVFENNEAVIKIILREEFPQWDMFPEPTELLLIGCLIESTWTPRSKSNTLTPRTNSQTYWQREISHVVNGIIFCVCSTSDIFSSTNCLKVMSKRIQEDASEEWVTAKSKPMMNLVSRCSVRDPNVLASTASESPRKTRYENQIPLSSWNEQQRRTGRPVMGASSSNDSEWNIDDKWSSQECKSGEMLGARTGRPVDDKFVINDDMDSDTVTESNLSLKSRSCLHRVNDRVRKILDHSSKDAMQDIDKRSLIWWMFMSSTLEASKFMWKNYSENLHSIKNIRNNLTLKQMFDTSEMLIIEQSGEILECLKLTGNTLHGIIYLWSVMKKSSVYRMQRFMYFGFCVMSWKGESEPNINCCLGREVELVQRFTTIQNFGHNRRRTDGIWVEYFPRIHYIGACPWSPKVHEQNGRTRTIPWTNHLHVDVQWHHMVK